MSDDKTQKCCMFCGATGKLTKEHVLRKKWRKHFDERPEGFLDKHTYFDPHGGPLKQSHKRYQRIPFDRQVKDVCSNCNSGWLSDLENAAEPTLLRLIQGEYGHLNDSELTLITRWVAKTAFVIERLDQSPDAATEEQRRAVMGGQYPPRFHAFMFPLVQNREVRLRSTPWYSHDGSHDHVFRFTTIHFHQVHFLSITSSDADAELEVKNLQLEEMLGPPICAITGGLDWPNQEPAPVVAVQLGHDVISRAMVNTGSLNGELQTF